MDKTANIKVGQIVNDASVLKDLELDLSKGDNVDGYILDHMLGFGTFGEVWKVSKNSEVFAMKFLKSDDITDLARFKSEVDIMRKINSDNIPKVYSGGLWQETHYIIIEFIEGENIEEYIKFNGAFNEEQIALVLLDLVIALMVINKNFNLLHRDIKPENIIIKEDGVPVLMDFGTAKIIGESPALTMTGFTIGTPNFMSPEQTTGDDLTCQTDIYSLGATAFFMAIGKNPKDSSSLAMTIKDVVEKPFPPITEYDNKFSKVLASIIKKMTRRQKATRYYTWEEVLEDLKKYLDKNEDAFEIDLESSRVIIISKKEKIKKNPKYLQIAILILVIIILSIIIICI